MARSSASRPVSVGVRLAASESYDPELCRRDLRCWGRRLFAADGRGRGEFLSAQGTPECESIIIYRQGETPHRPRRASPVIFRDAGLARNLLGPKAAQRSLVESDRMASLILSLYPPAGGFVGGCQRLCRPPGSPGTRAFRWCPKRDRRYSEVGLFTPPAIRFCADLPPWRPVFLAPETSMFGR